MAQLLDQCPSAITFEQRTDLTRLAARTSVCVLIPDIESHTETTQIHPRRLGGDPRETDAAAAGAGKPIGVEPADRGAPDALPLARIEGEKIGQPIRRTGLISLPKPLERFGRTGTGIRAD